MFLVAGWIIKSPWPPPIISPKGSPRTRRERLLDVLRILLSLGLLGFTAFAAFYKFSSVITMPGTADSVGPRLEVTGASSFTPNGKVLWATVSQVVEPRLLDMVNAWVRDEVDVQPKEKVLGDQTPEQNRKINQTMMDNSKQVAAIVVARRLGLPTRGGAIKVIELDPKAPAAKVLKANDEIVTVDGHSLCLVGDVRPLFASHKPGETVHLGVRRNGAGAVVPIDATLTSDRGRAIVGMIAGPSEKAPCKTSFDVNIRTGRIGGPSAGLAMTLALLDRLTEGELTGGKAVAATGTIESDGSVGEVGGVKQKTFAVKKAGAKLFIVPVAEVETAKPFAGDMKVVGVTNLDDALKALSDFGGDPLPKQAE